MNPSILPLIWPTLQHYHHMVPITYNMKVASKDAKESFHEITHKLNAALVRNIILHYNLKSIVMHIK